MKHGYCLLSLALLGLPTSAAAQRLGVNTTAPAQTLDVTTTSSDGAVIGLRNSASWDHLYFRHDASTAFVQAGGADTGLAFLVGVSAAGTYGDPRQNYREVLRLLPSGNVGIGTSTPSTSLEVAGQVKITGGTPGAGKVLTSDAAGLASWQAANVNTTSSQAVPTTTTSLTPTTAVLVLTDNNNATNGPLQLANGSGTDGQRVTIKNLDTGYVTITSASGTGNLLSGYSLQYVYTGTGSTGTWNLAN